MVMGIGGCGLCLLRNVSGLDSLVWICTGSRLFELEVVSGRICMG